MEDTNIPLSFWSQVWHEGTIRFHQKNYNQQMMNFFKDTDLKNKSVFIPLAGKTRDINYFLEKGAIVTAVEFVEQAVVDFFEENKIPYTLSNNLYESKNLKFYTMDFFDFNSPATFDVLYDRASQVVFSKEKRSTYYKHISKLIDKKTTLLLAAIDHNGSEDYGPPFKISKVEVQTAYKKMGIDLKIYSEIEEVASEKMQNANITSICSYYLSN